MQFLYPNFLWALGVLAIPIIIHLFYFRRFKKVYFTNVKYLQEIKEETASRNKLKNLLILLMRLLAMAAVVFAFAQPFIPQGNDVKKGNNAVSIFVDNSYSMKAEKDEIPLIDIAKEKARQVVLAYGEEDKFQILTHDFEGRHQRLIGKEEALAFIEEIDITQTVQTLSRVLQRQKSTIADKEENEIAYLLSDFQQSISSFNSIEDTTMEVNLLPIQSVQEANVSIDSAWLTSPVPMMNQANSVVVRLTNHSEEPAEGVRVSLQMNGQEKPEGTFTIPAKRTVIDTVKINLLKPGVINGALKVTDYPIQFDDTYYISLSVPASVKILSINAGSGNRYVNALFNGLNFYELTNQNQNKVDYANIGQYDLVLLNDLPSLTTGLTSVLEEYIQTGGNVLLFPSMSGNVDSYNQFLNNMAANNLQEKEKEVRKVATVNKDEFIFSDVFEYVNSNIKLPATNQNYKLSNFQSRGEEKLLRYRDGSGFLVKYERGDGHLYVVTSSLNAEVNDLVLNAEIFVPMLYKMAIASNKNQQIAYTIGADNILEVKKAKTSNDMVYTLSGEEEFIPGITNLGNKTLLSINDQIKKAGHFSLKLEDEVLNEYAFNYSRLESDLSMIGVKELETLVSQKGNFNVLDASLKQNFTEFIAQKDKGLVLWKWFLLAALAFLLVETLLLRFLGPKK